MIPTYIHTYRMAGHQFIDPIIRASVAYPSPFIGSAGLIDILPFDGGRETGKSNDIGRIRTS